VAGGPDIHLSVSRDYHARDLSATAERV